MEEAQGHVKGGAPPHLQAAGVSQDVRGGRGGLPGGWVGGCVGAWVGGWSGGGGLSVGRPPCVGLGCYWRCHGWPEDPCEQPPTLATPTLMPRPAARLEHVCAHAGGEQALVGTATPSPTPDPHLPPTPNPHAPRMLPMGAAHLEHVVRAHAGGQQTLVGIAPGGVGQQHPPRAAVLPHRGCPGLGAVPAGWGLGVRVLGFRPRAVLAGWGRSQGGQLGRSKQGTTAAAAAPAHAPSAWQHSS